MITGRVATLLRSFFPDLLDLQNLMVRAGFLGNDIYQRSSLFFRKWPQKYKAWDREGQYNYAIYNFPQFLRPQDKSKTEEDRTKMKNKADKDIHNATWTWEKLFELLPPP